MKEVVTANTKKFGKPNTNELSGSVEIHKNVLSDHKSSDFLNSIEKSLFGEFSNKQVQDFPPLRLKRAEWLEMICFEAEVDND